MHYMLLVCGLLCMLGGEHMLQEYYMVIWPLFISTLSVPSRIVSSSVSCLVCIR